jgi:uncharacterized heparinase superfamily protein
MGATPVDLLLMLMSYDETQGIPFSNAPYSAYQRLEAGGVVLIADTGRPPPIEMSVDAHAGCLSFEFSTPKRSLLVVNCGMTASGGEEWRHLARATAAHSTVTFNDTSSARFAELSTFRRVLGGSPIVAGPSYVAVAREDRPESIVLRAAHDGYAKRFGIIHERLWTLSGDGTHLDGEDVFRSDGTSSSAAPDLFAIRFHLHPAVKASRLSDGHGVMLTTPNREVWTFSAPAQRVEIEDSVFLGGNESPRRTLQVVIHGRARDAPQVQWTLRQANSAALGSAGAASREREKEPRLPL